MLNKDQCGLQMSEVASTILNYLLKHPSAKDTLEGITVWWILDEQISQAIEEVSKALNYLVSHEFVVVIKYRNQEKYYQINKEKMENIKTLLIEADKENGGLIGQ